MLDLESLLRIHHVDQYLGFDLAPDERRVAFAWNRTGQWEIYELLIDQPRRVTRITNGPGAKFNPRYSPDGMRIAYVVDLDGGENYDLFIYDRVTQQHINLTPDTPEALQPDFDWSPRGDQLVILSDREGCFSPYVLSLKEGSLRSVMQLTDPAFNARWSPDGQWLAIAMEARGQDFHTFLVPAEGGDPQFIIEASEPLNASQVDWSPDGKKLAFSSDTFGFYDIGVFDLDTKSVSWITQGRGDKKSPRWSPDGRSLVYVHHLGGDTALVVVDLEENTRQTYQVESGVHELPRFTSDGHHIVCIFENPKHPPHLWCLSLQDGVFRQLSRFFPRVMKSEPFLLPQEINYPCPDPRFETVPALLFLPRGEPPFPTVVLIHGGPTWLYQISWMPMVQHMVSRGWAVLAPNYRGSSGYGKEWQLANRYELGGVDTKDIVAGVDFLVAEGIANPKKIAVTGRSHGGYLTMTCLTQFPDRWIAGSAVVPFLNWFTAHENSRQDLQHWDIENMGNPEDNQALWFERSPAFFLDRIQVPVQLICGAHDPRCPASEALQAHRTLKSLGKIVELFFYPDEGHSFLKLDNLIDSEIRRVSFLSRYLDD